MAKTDWNITGPGGQAIIDQGGSMRCRLSHQKLMLWNGRDNLANSEVVAELRPGDSYTFSGGGLVLRSSLTAYDCYRLRVVGPRTCYIQKVVDGLVTTLATVASSQPYNIYVKTRFRVDGFQLSVEEWYDGAWHLLMTVLDTSQALAMGYAGLLGDSVNPSYFFLFDNVEIAEAV